MFNEKDKDYMFKNKYLVVLICLVLFLINSCKDSASLNKPKQDEVLLSKLSLPRGYTLIFKDIYYPEGEISNKNDSIYAFKKDGSKIEITIKYFNKDEVENIDDRINSFIEVLHTDNNSFAIEHKKVNKELRLWYLKYTFGTTGHLMHNLYMEHDTAKYRIAVKSFDYDISLADIESLYMQISKYPNPAKSSD